MKTSRSPWFARHLAGWRGPVLGTTLLVALAIAFVGSARAANAPSNIMPDANSQQPCWKLNLS